MVINNTILEIQQVLYEIWNNGSYVLGDGVNRPSWI